MLRKAVWTQQLTVTNLPAGLMFLSVKNNKCGKIITIGDMWLYSDPVKGRRNDNIP